MNNIQYPFITLNDLIKANRELLEISNNFPPILKGQFISFIRDCNWWCFDKKEYNFNQNQRWSYLSKILLTTYGVKETTIKEIFYKIKFRKRLSITIDIDIPHNISLVLEARDDTTYYLLSTAYKNVRYGVNISPNGSISSVETIINSFINPLKELLFVGNDFGQYIGKVNISADFTPVKFNDYNSYNYVHKRNKLMWDFWQELKLTLGPEAFYNDYKDIYFNLNPNNNQKELFLNTTEEIVINNNNSTKIDPYIQQTLMLGVWQDKVEINKENKKGNTVYRILQ